jgi:hypothetical protein
LKFVPYSPPAAGSSRPWGTKRRIVTLIQIASLLTTAWVVWEASLVPRLHHGTLGALLWHVVGYTFLAWVWSALVAIGLYMVLPLEDRSDVVPNVLRMAATAVWFGPAMILLSEFSPAALLAALVLVVYASRLLYTQWRPVEVAVPRPPRAPRQAGEFEDCQLPQDFFWRDRWPAVAVAFCLESGAIAVATHFPLLGAAFLCMGTALLTVFSMSTGVADAGRPPTLPRSILGILATVVLAALLSVGGGMGRGASSPGESADQAGREHPGFVESARTVLHQLFYGESPDAAGSGGPAAPKLPSPVDTGAAGGFPGVIIWPEIKPVTTLVAPLPAMSPSLFQGKAAQPLGIPFDGEYWMFRWPFAKPPASSFLERGTPAELSFSSTDHTPLQMEAHQKLETPIDVSCCRAIQLEVVNADHYPGTLSLELTLLNTEDHPPQWLRLGSVPVTAWPDLSHEHVIPVRQTLEFEVPAQSMMQQFTEFKIVFLRARLRMDKSARLAIQRFVLLPR